VIQNLLPTETQNLDRYIN